jgi:hypothetical protein
MKESPRCLGCGDILPAGAGLRVCARCRDPDALSLTEPYRPGQQAVVVSPPAFVATVGLADFRRAAIELGLLDTASIDRIAVGETTTDVSDLATRLVLYHSLIFG